MRDLLLLLCQFPFNPNNRATLSQLLLGVEDWDKLVKLINAHGIIALAAYNIKEARLEKDIPTSALTILENGYMQSIVRNTWLTERWKEVNLILSNAGINHILLKGMALEHTLYGSKGLRQMNDNDILIKPDDSIKAWLLLQEHGFTLEPAKSPLFRKIMLNIGHHLPTLYKNGYAIEIHYKLFDPDAKQNKNFDNLFSETEEISIGDTKALILSTERQLQHLIRHFEHHTASGDCQLRLYTDIRLMDKRSTIEMPDRFIPDPMQGNKKEFRKASYLARIQSIPPKYKLRFIIGDTFPSIKWMKKRYRCTWFEAILRYPLRIGKILWLINL